VIDDKSRIRLINESAKNLMGITRNIYNTELEKLDSGLMSSVADWADGKGRGTFIFKPVKGEADVQVSLSRLNLENRTEVLIFLDDVSKLRQQAQQLKLASLGRLTASIAHEVRNPLGAISHAGQLLSESAVLNDEDRRLTAIITEQSVRVNSIIENVMRISRRDRPVPAAINLQQWLGKFVEELRSRYRLTEGDLEFNMTGDNILANMDPGQLYQVMWNICENGIRYSRARPLLVIRCAVQQESQRPFVDIIDSGTGIAADIAEQLFEPFVTTEAKGTGLGLFIARELCEANQATLNLYANSDQGCCFRINFSHPDRRQGLT
jgi:two-component system sensor histidine kinase PilS (NtrC family)